MSAEPSTTNETAEFIHDVRRGLNTGEQKFLQAKYFYDEIGSSLFEVITQLPEYGLTRADERLIRQHTSELVRGIRPGTVVAELGSGSGAKTYRILEELTRQGPVRYLPIDISRAALERCEADLRQIDGVEIEPLRHPYLEGLKRTVSSISETTPLLLLFLGSTIGNFDRASAQAFLGDLHARLRPDDTLLLGTDLVKPVPRLLAAYDDPTGVTAAFNRNILARINRELDANFDVAAFEHHVRYDDRARRVEMHLRASTEQQIVIPAAELEVTFQKGETIWTESSHKFRSDEVIQMGNEAGFRCVVQWLDQEWPFAESLFQVE